MLIPPENFVARPVSWLQAISETRATVSVAPNFAFGLVSERVKPSDLEGLNLSSWQVALCGAEPVHPKTMDPSARRCRPWVLIPPPSPRCMAAETLAVSRSTPSHAGQLRPRPTGE